MSKVRYAADAMAKEIRKNGGLPVINRASGGAEAYHIAVGGKYIGTMAKHPKTRQPVFTHAEDRHEDLEMDEAKTLVLGKTKNGHLVYREGLHSPKHNEEGWDAEDHSHASQLHSDMSDRYAKDKKSYWETAQERRDFHASMANYHHARSIEGHPDKAVHGIGAPEWRGQIMGYRNPYSPETEKANRQFLRNRNKPLRSRNESKGSAMSGIIGRLKNAITHEPSEAEANEAAYLESFPEEEREQIDEARFRATLQGARGPASRLGHQGIEAHVNGWNQGVHVVAKRGEGDEDEFHIYATGGSNGGHAPTFLGHVGRHPQTGKPHFFPASHATPPADNQT